MFYFPMPFGSCQVMFRLKMYKNGKTKNKKRVQGNKVINALFTLKCHILTKISLYVEKASHASFTILYKSVKSMLCKGAVYWQNLKILFLLVSLPNY